MLNELPVYFYLYVNGYLFPNMSSICAILHVDVNGLFGHGIAV